MASWLENFGADLSYTCFFENPALPRINDLDLLIIMGGPMSANDESTLPWLRAEKVFIRDAVESGVSVLGVCLGAQLIASALGARVWRNPQKEIGWFPVEGVTAEHNAFSFPKELAVFHWHGETFDLPRGAVQLAKTIACENQAFQIGRKVIGLQFHLEATPETVGDILDNCGSELAPGPYIQTASQLRSVDNAAYVRINRIMDDVLFYVTSNEK